MRVAAFLQFFEESPTGLGALCHNDLVEGGGDICWSKALRCQNTAPTLKSIEHSVCVFTFHSASVPGVQEGSGGFCSCLVPFVWADGRWLVTKQQQVSFTDNSK